MERYEVLYMDHTRVFASDSLQAAKDWVETKIQQGALGSDYAIFDTKSGETWYTPGPSEDNPSYYRWAQE